MACDNYEKKEHADAMILTYGSELAGDVLNCKNCGCDWHEHRHEMHGGPQNACGEWPDDWNRGNGNW